MRGTKKLLVFQKQLAYLKDKSSNLKPQRNKQEKVVNSKTIEWAV